ncbi:hypothetical protein [Alicyclobacillus dauci]|uniref:CcmD family protein n=1 Tax=Alicyclobacillus dauci TaxID=1475485 RepID=A0ABY6Z8T7_9BACL|nr:hypothetical protein [Alicyclobacillus dauci]WAH38480.1 hypothetical protein NZD86_08365 [Alicyclobacillus dauci]
MRDSNLYFALAILFAMYLTWRILASVRKTMKAAVRTDETEE